MAKKVFQYANEEALGLDHACIRTEHILLALLRKDNETLVALPSAVLRKLGLNYKTARAIAGKIKPGNQQRIISIASSTVKLPQSFNVKKAVEYALEEANALHHSYVGAEHLLLGLLRVEGCTARKVLGFVKIRTEEIRNELLNLLGCDDGKAQATPKEKVRKKRQFRCEIFTITDTQEGSAKSASDKISEFLKNANVKEVFQSSTSKATYISIWYWE